MTSTAAAVLMQRLGLSDDELLQVLGADPLSVVGGNLDDKPQLPILLALTQEVAERVQGDALKRWVRTAGPAGRPIDHLLDQDFPAFEDALVTLQARGFVVRARGR